MSNIVHGSLTAEEVATVTLGRNYGVVEILNRTGEPEIYFTVDGPDPTVGADDCQVLPAAIGAPTCPVWDTWSPIHRSR